MNTGFDFAMGLAAARNLPEVMELQATYWQKLLVICRRNAAHSQPRALEGEIGKAAATTVRGSLSCEHATLVSGETVPAFAQ